MMDKGLAVAEKMQMLGVSIGADGISMDLEIMRIASRRLAWLAGATNVLGSCTENPAR